MKAGLQIALAGMLAAGCAQSRFKNDPRAAVVGPDYLDYIDQYPRDRDTQYYYPGFSGTGAKTAEGPSVDSLSASIANIQALLTRMPEVPPEVQKIEGKGWPELERQGIPY